MESPEPPVHRLGYLLVWAALMAVSFTAAPPTRPDQTEWVLRLLTGDWAGEDALVVAHFMLMGVWPWLIGAQAAPLLSARPLPLWPFVLLANALGAFALLPGLFLRPPSQRRQPSSGPLRLLAGRGVVSLLTLATLTLSAWGLFATEPGVWWHATKNEAFMFIMGFDFLAFWLTSMLLQRELGRDWRWALLPMVGPLLDLWFQRSEPRAAPSP